MSSHAHATLAVGAVAGAIGATALHRQRTSHSRKNSANSNANASSSSLPQAPRGNGKNVGILALEVYTPRTYITQSALEEHSGVSAGRYTLGLGQEALAVTGDAEDVNSMALTVTHSLLEKYDIDPNDVGRLEVGTETLVDKSKSTKTVLMDLFGDNTDIEGATVINACYGGTAALLNAFNWVESDAWDGRYAIVVAVDIAAYARGPARPTCGAGAVAVLIGRNAPLAMVDPRERATHASNVYDFFKPDHNVEYPVVDGALSQVCYYRALEDCYGKFCDRVDRLNGAGKVDGNSAAKDDEHFHAEAADYFVFHAPYNKLVQKSYGRMHFLDARRKHARELKRKDSEEKKDDSDVEDKSSTSRTNDSVFEEEHLTKPIEETYSDKALEGSLKNVSKASYKQRLTDANSASKIVGNTYTASVFLGLASLVDQAGGRGELTAGKTAVVFSYGSGAIATMYRLHVRDPTSLNGERVFTIDEMANKLDLTARLETREEVHPQELDLALETRAKMHHAGAPYSPVYPTVGRMFPGTYYLNGISSKWVRSYSRVPLDSQPNSGGMLAPPIALRLAARDTNSTPATGMLGVLARSVSNTALDKYAEAKHRVACVITGTSAGLPYGDSDGREVFDPSNLQALVEGKVQCIRPISGTLKMAMLDKNVVQLKKYPGGKTERFPISSDKDVIKVAAQLGDLDLNGNYGVPEGLAATMDIAAQVAVAAGLEALKSAGLVSGNSSDPAEWKLPERFRDTTGVVYASSFPAMDAAVGEVMKYLQSKTVGAQTAERLVFTLRNRLLRAHPERMLEDEDEAAFARLLSRVREVEGGGNGSDDASVSSTASSSPYEFDRKFLFRVLVLGNAQLAQIAGCRGPNTQTNAACAGTTQAIGMAQDMLISGRAERVVVVAGDNGSGGTLLPWLGSGFRALGAATTEEAVENASCPFDKRRSGMIMGAGGIGMVLETESSCQERIKMPVLPGCMPCQIRARLLATQYSNSAFHGAALDRKHIASELKRFLNDVELVHGIGKAEIATHGVYFSHETSTHASPAASCAGNEVAALRIAFGDDLLSKLLILNTKGFTGHPMGVSFEDVAAVEVLMRQVVPPVPNYKERDDYLGELNISKGGAYACRYALRFAAGFGSQVAFALYASSQHE